MKTLIKMSSGFADQSVEPGSIRRVKFLGTNLHASTMADTLSHIDHRIATRNFTQHVVVNVAKLVHMRSDPELRASVEECDVVNVDGMGVVWGGRLLGMDLGERVAGVDLFSELIALSAKKSYPVFLLGAKDDVVREVCRRLLLKFPSLDIAGFHHGYFWEDEEAIVGKIRESGARLLFVAITSPRKENFIARWKDQLGVDFVMGVGGTFDVVAGVVRRAPVWMQRSGLEWFYRVLQEPRRMWRRYFKTNLVFAGLLLKARFSSSNSLVSDE